MAKMNRALQVRTIKADLVRAGHDPETVDVEALVDGNLSLPENRRLVAQKLRYRLGKTPGVREAKRRADVGACESLRHQCEIKNDTESCRDYGRSKCAPVTGKIPGCRTCSTGKEPKAKKGRARLIDGQCMIPIKAHFRRCPPNMTAKASGRR